MKGEKQPLWVAIIGLVVGIGILAGQIIESREALGDFFALCVAFYLISNGWKQMKGTDL